MLSSCSLFIFIKVARKKLSNVKILHFYPFKTYFEILREMEWRLFRRKRLFWKEILMPYFPERWFCGWSFRLSVRRRSFIPRRVGTNPLTYAGRKENSCCSACGHQLLEDLTHLLDYPASEPLRRAILDTTDVGAWPDCWVSVELFHIPIPLKGSGSNTITIRHNNIGYFKKLQFTASLFNVQHWMDVIEICQASKSLVFFEWYSDSDRTGGSLTQRS